MSSCLFYLYFLLKKRTAFLFLCFSVYANGLTPEICQQIFIDYVPCPNVNLPTENESVPAPSASINIQSPVVQQYAKLPSSPNLDLNTFSFVGKIEYKDGVVWLDGKALQQNKHSALKKACQKIECQ